MNRQHVAEETLPEDLRIRTSPQLRAGYIKSVSDCNKLNSGMHVSDFAS